MTWLTSPFVAVMVAHHPASSVLSWKMQAATSCTPHDLPSAPISFTNIATSLSDVSDRFPNAFNGIFGNVSDWLDDGVCHIGHDLNRRDYYASDIFDQIKNSHLTQPCAGDPACAGLPRGELDSPRQ